jgi:hypothetical protein
LLRIDLNLADMQTSDDPAVSINIDLINLYHLTKQQTRQALLGLRAKRLLALRSINSIQTDTNLFMTAAEHSNRITI